MSIISSTITSAIVKKALDFLLKPLTEEFIKQMKYKSEEKKKIDLLYKNINRYALNKYKDFSKTKTFLHRNEPVDFDKVYFNISLQKIEALITKKTKSDISVVNVNSFFYENNGCVSLISFAGSGKTMLTKKIFLDSIRQHENIKKIPILLELRNINSSIQEHLESILDVNDDISKKLLKFLFEQGLFIFLFDGYDEISLEKKKNLTYDIEKFVNSYDKNYFLITSRPQAGIENFSKFTNYRLKDLNDKQINEFVTKQLYDKKLAEKIISVIEESKTKKVINEYLKNPLLLSMFILEFENYPEIPTKKSIFYRNVYDTLCTKHDSHTKTGAYQHERKSGLSNENIETILELFSFLSFFEQRYSFDENYLKDKLKTVRNSLNIHFDIDNLIYDLTISISILIHDGEYKFPHRSIQEYFTISYIKKIQKEDNKEKIYQKIPLYSDSNFYNLCEEQDKSSFYKYYVIPKLESIKKNKTEIINNIFQNFYIEINKDRKPKQSSRTVSFEEQIFNIFVNNNLISSTILKLKYDKIPKTYCIEISNSDNLRINFSIYINDPKFYKIICEIGLDEFFIEYTKQIEDKINQLQEIIKFEEQKEESIMNLLKFS